MVPLPVYIDTNSLTLITNTGGCVYERERKRELGETLKRGTETECLQPVFFSLSDGPACVISYLNATHSSNEQL